MKNLFRKILFVTTIVASTTMAFTAPTKVYAGAPEKVTKVSTDTCKNQDTVLLAFNAIGSHLKTLTVTVTKLTGTLSTSSYVLMEGTGDGTNWEVIPGADTLTLANQTTNFHIWKFTTTQYYSYRARYVTPSSTQTSTISITYMRRPDE